MKYYGNPIAIDKFKKLRFGMTICFALGFFMSFLYYTQRDGREFIAMVSDFSRDLDMDYDVLDGFTRFFMLAVFCFSLTQCIGGAMTTKTIRSISESYLEIRQSTVIGKAQTTLDKHISLEYVQIPLNQIRNAYSNGEIDGFNLIVSTARDEYRFLAIKNAQEAAQEINKRIKDIKQPVSNTTEKNYCWKCGAVRASDAIFCEHCGASFTPNTSDTGVDSKPIQRVDTGWECPYCLQQNSRYDMFCKGCASPRD